MTEANDLSINLWFRSSSIEAVGARMKMLIILYFKNAERYNSDSILFYLRLAKRKMAIELAIGILWKSLSNLPNRVPQQKTLSSQQENYHPHLYDYLPSVCF